MAEKQEDREKGLSTEPEGSAIDRLQFEAAQSPPDNRGNTAPDEEDTEVKKDEKPKSVEVDKNAALLELDPEPMEDEEPKQVEDPTVLYVPRRDFEARVNQQPFTFRAGVPTRVSRDVAAMLLEDDDRGYVRD